MTRPKDGGKSETRRARAPSPNHHPPVLPFIMSDNVSAPATASTAFAAMKAAQDLLSPYKATEQLLPLPIASMQPHPSNRAYSEHYAAQLAGSLRSRLFTAKHPCQVIIRLKEGLGESGDSTMDAFRRLEKEHPDAFLFNLDLLQKTRDDLNWLFDTFEVSSFDPSTNQSLSDTEFLYVSCRCSSLEVSIAAEL